MKPASGIEFVPNAGAGVELARSLFMAEKLLAVAEVIKAKAMADPLPHRLHGNYAKAFDTRVALTPTGYVGLTFNKDQKAHWVEFGVHPGGGQTEAMGYHVLGRAAEMAAGDSGE
jgi:hypothetical protein